MKNFLVMIFIFILFSLQFITAGSIGISPTKFNFFFEPNLEKSFIFNVVDADSDSNIEAYISGDFAEYVTLNQTEFTGRGVFEATLKLPEKIEKPGNHRILIGVRQTIENITGGAVKGVAAVQAAIDVYVPYPGKYIESEFEIQSINKGEDAFYNFMIHNLGTEDIVALSEMRVLDSGKVIYSYKFEDIHLDSKEQIELAGRINSSNFDSGFYEVEVIINYGKSLILNDTLKVGNNFVNITDYDYIFETGKINKMDVQIENLWNLEMKEVFFEISLSEKGVVLDSAKSSSKSLAPWEVSNLTGFVDGTNLLAGKYLMTLNLKYGAESNNKLVYVYFVDPPKDHTLVYIMIFLGILVLVLILVLVIKIHKLIKQNRLMKKDGKK